MDGWSVSGAPGFTQKIKLNNKNSFKVEGNIEYQICDDKACVYDDTSFSRSIKGNKVEEVTPVVDVEASNPLPVDSSAEVTTTIPVDEKLANGRIPEPSGDASHLEAGCGDGIIVEDDKSYWGIFIAGMLGGLLALLTPCVFPMIPLTVSFFTKRSPTRQKGIANAIIYSTSIILIYVILGFLVTVTLGSDALNAMARFLTRRPVARIVGLRSCSWLMWWTPVTD